MSKIGIIANPASGKDIRRLVSHASTFDNLEKVHILRRILLALDTLRVEQIIYMPDYESLVEAAFRGVRAAFKKVVLPLTMMSNERDTIEAGRLFVEMGVDCVITLGGDGTNRALAKSCGAIPLIALSTGTNNVFPSMMEGTVAGLAAGLVAKRMVDVKKVSYVAKRLEVFVDGRMEEIALIDAVACTELFVGSRALWDPGRIREIILARAEPASIGISCVGGLLRPVGPEDDQGLYLMLGEGKTSVLAPVGPGLIRRVAVEETRLLSLGEEVELKPAAFTIAVDGERQTEISPEQRVRVRLTRNGPCVVDVRACLLQAGRMGVLVDDRNAQYT